MAKLSTFTAKASPVAADYVYLYSIADLGERRTTLGEFLTGQTLLNCVLTNPTMTTPTLGVATATSLNGVALSSTGTATLVVANGKTVTLNSTMTLAAGADGRTFTFPSASGTVATLNTAQTFSAAQIFSSGITTTTLAATNTIIQTVSSSNALVSGPNGNTNPVFRTVTNIASAETGISITGRAAAAGVDITVLSSGTNENLVINAKGSGSISLNSTGTGNIIIGRATIITSTAATAFACGYGGSTNPGLSLINDTGSGNPQNGVSITASAETTGVSIAATSSAANESLSINAKGSGVLRLGNSSTGGTIIGNTNFQVAYVVSATTGLKITPAADSAGVALSVINGAAADENFTVDAKGAGTITLNGTATGNIVLGRAMTGVSASLTGALQLFSATAVPAGGTTGSGLKFSSTSNLGIFFGSGAPSLSAAQGSLYIRTDGSSSSTRLYVNSTGSTTWVNITSAS